MDDPIVTAWQTHGRLQIEYVKAIQAVALAAKLGGKGRSVGAILAHMHHNRLAWLEPAAPDLMVGLVKVDKTQTGDTAVLVTALQTSTDAIATLLTRSLAAGGKVKGFGGQAASFFGYLVAHESYHHGEIGIILAQAGFALDNKTAYGLWNWK
ncbi:MAG TPA: DinB family protein [Chloroflexota bacterium]|nr:DinB family protein [Chloroflexota bacterium]